MTRGQWSFGPSGTLVVHGTAGQINVNLWDVANQKIHIVGTWTCPN